MRRLVLLGAATLALALAAAPRPASGQTAAGTILVMGAGDISPEPSDPSTNDVATFSIMAAANPAVVLTLGDNQYENGTYAKYTSLNGYAGSWGRLKGRTRPSPGNHEYYDPAVVGGQGAAGYYNYFRDRLTGLACQVATPACHPEQGFYSHDLANGWHLISLNSDCGRSDGTSPSCAATGPMVTWLRADLAAHAAQKCTLAYWHVERWGSHAPFEDDPLIPPLWNTLNDAKAELVLVGHSHAYARLGPMTNAGTLATNADGMRQISVGTGGKSLIAFDQPARTGTRYRDDKHFGVLRLALTGDGAGAGSGSWASTFARTDGVRADPTGTVGCRG
jgi:hypothetical protein